MKSILLLLLPFAAVSASAQEARYASLQPMQWLSGSWSGTYKDAPFYEAWRSAGDSLLINFSIGIKGVDTVVKENSAVRLMKDGSIRMMDSGNDAWMLTRLTVDELVLENDTLKYANKITWSHAKNGHWLTVIQNPGGTVKYDMTRAPWLDAVIDRYVARVESGRK